MVFKYTRRNVVIFGDSILHCVLASRAGYCFEFEIKCYFYIFAYKFLTISATFVDKDIVSWIKTRQIFWEQKQCLTLHCFRFPRQAKSAPSIHPALKVHVLIRSDSLTFKEPKAKNYEWLSTRELFWMKIVDAFMFDGPQSAGTKLIWLVNWMWRDSSVIPGGQQVRSQRQETITVFDYLLSYVKQVMDIWSRRNKNSDYGQALVNECFPILS